MNRPTKKILLIDDDEDDYIITRSFLSEAQGWNFELTWASSFPSALDLLKSFQPDAVLLDYHLGSFTGLDLINEARQHIPHIPIIMLTGAGSIDIDLKAMQAGATDYLVKSEVNAGLLERTLRYAIEQQQIKNELRRARDELDERVRERTKELEQANADLISEIAERQRIAAELNELQSRLIDSTEAERRHYAQELHDGPMQEIYGVIYAMELIKRSCENTSVSNQVTQLQQALQSVNQALRVTAGELRPPALAPYGLEKAFRSHIEHFHQAHPDLEVILELFPDRQRLPERVRLAMFRIYQMAITNVIRHAQATQVHVRFWVGDHETVVEIEDNGRGFNLPSNWISLARGGHLGLVGARERAEAVGGTLEVVTAPGKGTLVRALVPIPPENQPDQLAE